MKKGKICTLLAAIMTFAIFLSSCGTIEENFNITEDRSEVSDVLNANSKQMTALPCQLGVDESTNEKYLIQYTEIARNSNSILYADLQKGFFAVQDISTEKIWYSTPNNSELDTITGGTERMEIRSQILVRYVLKEEESTVSSYKVENSQRGCVASGGVKTKQINNGIQVTYSFKNCGIKIPVTYTLTKDSFRAEILADKIDEGDRSYLIGIDFLPSFGAGDWDDNGYLFVPDGCGAIIDFNGHSNMESSYNKMVYGEEYALKQTAPTLNSEEIRMPVFGTVTDGSCLMGIITKGDTSSSISASYGTNTWGYNSVRSVFNYRTIDCKEMFSKQGGINSTLYRVSKIHSGISAYRVEYRLLSGEKADYMGMAEEYRNYLSENGCLKEQKAEPCLDLEVYGAAKLNKSFLGINYNTTQVLTTFKQAKKIAEVLQGKGITDINMRYIGFSGDGILNNKINVDSDPIGKLGSTKEFYGLSDLVNLYPDFDVMRIQKGGNGLSLSTDVIRTVFGYKAEQKTFSRSVYNAESKENAIYLLTPKAVLGASTKLIKNYAKTECKNISLTRIGDMLYSDYDADNGFFRDTSSSYIEESLKRIRKNCSGIALENANAYLFEYADKIWNAPVYSSGYDIYSTDVPFYQIVLHGSTTLTSPTVIQSEDPSVTVLKAAETGSELNFACTYKDSTVLIGSRFENLYSTRYADWLDYAVKAYEKYQPLLKKIYNQKIIYHKEVSNGVFVTGYENGIYVAVNYNDRKYVFASGDSVSGKDYCEIQGGAVNG